MPNLTLSFPQWQGAGLRGRPIAGGAAVLASAIGDVDEVIDVVEHADSVPTDGVVNKSEILLHLKRAVETLARRATSNTDAVLMIGGDCSTDLAAIAHSAARWGNGLAVVYVDAHADSNTPASSPSGSFHGMVIRHAIGDGDPDVRCIVPATIAPAQILLVGVREEDAPEVAWCAEQQISRFPASVEGYDVANHTIVSNASAIHVHLDLDVLEPAEFPHTTYPTPNGMSVASMAALVDACAATGRLVSVGITESVADVNEVTKIQPVIAALQRWRTMTKTQTRSLFPSRTVERSFVICKQIQT